MKFLMLVCVESDQSEADEAPDAADTNVADAEESGSFPWLDDVTARGIRLDGDRLRPPREAKTVLVRDGEVLISDGPFAETKEVICGYDVSSARTSPKPSRWRRRIPSPRSARSRSGRSGPDTACTSRRSALTAAGSGGHARRWSAAPPTGRSAGPGPGWCR